MHGNWKRQLATPGTTAAGLIIRMTNITYLKLKLAICFQAQHTLFVSSNFCKELDLARFYQRAFFCLSLLPLSGGIAFRCAAKSQTPISNEHKNSSPAEFIDDAS